MVPVPLLFVSLAMNQTRFFGALDEALPRRRWAPVHLCFHERSADWLARHGLASINAYRHPAYGRPLDAHALLGARLEGLLQHEAEAFEIPAAGKADLAADFGRFLAVADACLAELQAGSNRRPVVVQELGGFVSVLAVYEAARRRGLRNLFIEPSFFRGRVFFTSDSLAAPQVPPTAARPPQPDMLAYLAGTLEKRAIVIPSKDARHYRVPGRKLRDPYNLRRLIEKLADKYLLRRREVFSHIGLHVARHLRMVTTERRLRGTYRALPADRPFVYFPLHVPADVALTLRSPAFLDQYALIEALAAMLPEGVDLAIKEHPALVGALDRARAQAMLARCPNLLLLNPALNNFAVMDRAAAVVTVNSKSGAEAALLGRPVVVLGDAFYRRAPLVRSVDGLEAARPLLLEALEGRWRGPTRGEAERWFQAVWDESFPGELYDTTPANVARFAASLDAALQGDRLRDAA